MLVAQGVGDVVDGEVVLAHLDDEAPGRGLLRLLLRAARRVDEEDPIGIAAEVVAQDAEGGGVYPNACATSALGLRSTK